MRARVLSSIAVVIVGLLPALCGGPLFAAFLVLLFALGYREYVELAARLEFGGARLSSGWGYLAILALALAAFRQSQPAALFIAITVALSLPLGLAIRDTASPGTVTTWALLSAGSLYLGLPVYAAIALRELPGPIEATWLSDLAAWLAIGWESTPRGLAWVLAVILTTWVGDSSAYLGGSWLGRHKLAPRISPGKTVEGAISGVIGSVVVSIAWFAATGLASFWVAATVGVIVAASGQLGDLVESMLKRQAGVKDSGSMIPGHGGILDRIDALVFTFPATYLAALAAERFS